MGYFSHIPSQKQYLILLSYYRERPLLLMLKIWTRFSGIQKTHIKIGMVPLIFKPVIQVRAQHDTLVSERWNAIRVQLAFSHQCWRLVQQRQSMCYYVCDNACKRSLVICRKSRASCPISRLLSVPIWPACDKQGRQCDSNKQTNNSTIPLRSIQWWVVWVAGPTSYMYLSNSTPAQGKSGSQGSVVRLLLVF